MTKRVLKRKNADPVATRPFMPGYGIQDANSGLGLLPWSWAMEHLAKARSYWVATTRPDGWPHTMPVWGVWVDDRFYFSTGRQSRKARNLEVNSRCVVCAEPADEAVIVEGIATETTDRKTLRRFAERYGEKYSWDMEGFAEPVYMVRPTVVFGFKSAPDEFAGSATRWIFDND